jgi:hypothetical protein
VTGLGGVLACGSSREQPGVTCQDMRVANACVGRGVGSTHPANAGARVQRLRCPLKGLVHLVCELALQKRDGRRRPGQEGGKPHCQPQGTRSCGPRAAMQHPSE